MTYRSNYKQSEATEDVNKKRILEVCPIATEESGIYVFWRQDENGFKFAYCGQAKHLLTRMSQHLNGYPQHIDASIKKHGLYGKNNPFGYKATVFFCKEVELDEQEQKYIKNLADKGYQLRNKTAGSQGKGKSVFDTERKGYRQGLKKGYENAIKEIAHLFDLHLTVGTKKQPPTIPQQKALNKFLEMIGRCENDTTQKDN